MRIAICEDNESEMDRLKSILELYIDKNMINAKIDCFYEPKSFIEEFNKKQYDIVFQDIILKESNGVDVSKEIKKIKEDVVIIFTSSSKEYMADGYNIGVTHYLVKPVNKDDVFESLRRAFKIIGKTSKYIEVTVDRVDVVVYLKNILYVEIYKNTCIIHEKNRDIKTYATLNEIQQKINDEHFVRCHKSYLVNIESVIDFKDYDLIVKNGDKVPMRKNDKKEIMDIINKYLKEMVVEDEFI